MSLPIEQRQLLRAQIRAKIQEQVQRQKMPQVPQTLEGETVQAAKAFGTDDLKQGVKDTLLYGPGDAAVRAYLRHPKEAHTVASYPARKSAQGLKMITDAIPPVPTSNAALSVAGNAPKVAADMLGEISSSTISPEGGAVASALPVLGAALKPAGKFVLKKAGKLLHAIPEEATEVAMKNPEVTKGDFITPGKIEAVTKGLKSALDDMKKKIGQMYDDVLGKFERAKKPGLGEPEKVMGKFDEIEKTLGVRKVKFKKKTKAGEVEKFDKYAGKKGTQQQVSNEELQNLTEVRHKFEQDVERRARSGKLTANDLVNERRMLDRYADWRNKGSVYNAKLKEVRKTVDDEVRKYPEIKKVDAENVKFERTQGVFKRRTGVQAGQTANREVTDQQVQKTANLLKRLFTKDQEVVKKALEKATKDVGASYIMDDIDKLAAAEQFGTSREGLIQLFGVGLNPRKVGKSILGGMIRSGKAAFHSGASDKLKKLLPGVARRKKKDEK